MIIFIIIIIIIIIITIIIIVIIIFIIIMITKEDANDHLVPLGGRSQLKRDGELWQQTLVGFVHLTVLTNFKLEF